jgi:propionyl-CoA carboxylase alpha chain
VINRLLVANRGEIASRVFATCRRLGIETVAIHSDADAGLPYVPEADAAVRLPGNAPADTYLDIDAVLDAAKRASADAIHPGYGFLSENAEFARAVEDAGLTWIGPTPKSIEAMGSKIEAKRIMREAGVPVLDAPEPPTDDDLPLIVKASAGGGGRGMRVVRSLANLESEIRKAREEAESAFGDGTIFVEPYVERGRHVEVQVVGDEFGTVLVFGERDCSIQRRHQKVVEEAPAPRLPEATRQALHDAARAAAAAIDYRGAGTVEFLYDSDADRFFFLEMNTRLQVEHPVTEAVFGVDLVELQLGVAEHEKVPVLIGDLTASGHAIEVRVYAEDPAADHAPQSGVLTLFEIPEAPGVRVDAGYASGSTVSTFYDAMLAKVICHATTRERAARQLAGVLARARIHGVTTNRDQLVAILTDHGFLAGEVSTAFLAQSTLSELQKGPDRATLVAAALMLAEDDAVRRTVQQGIPVGWRNVVSQPQRTEFEGHPPVEWVGGRDGYLVDGLTVLDVSPERVRLEVDGVASVIRGHIRRVAAGAREVHLDGPMGSASLREVPRFVDPADAVASGSLLAHMPGTVVRVAVEVGQAVEAGDTVLVLEAMKMQHTVTAPQAGLVTEIDVRPGAQVVAGEILAVVEEQGAEQ